MQPIDLVLKHNIEDHLGGPGFVHFSMHARLTAVGFYAKLGYSQVSPEFLEVGIPHVKMEKRRRDASGHRGQLAAGG